MNDGPDVSAGMNTTPDTSTGTDDTPVTAAGLLSGKVAFVTGAGRGIGAAARLFAREGARVLLAARTEAQLEAVTEEIRAAGCTADHVLCDVADADSVRAAVDQTVELYGRLDVAFNNGATIQPPGPMDQLSDAEFDRITAQNPLGGAADPEEIAQAAAWLLSDRASYVTGVILRVDSGTRA